MSPNGPILVHLASGIGNIVLATPLLQVLAQNGYQMDLLVDGDYGGIGELFHHWGNIGQVLTHPPDPAGYAVLVPAVPPFYWYRHARFYAGRRHALRRPPDRRFYTDEQGYYLDFAAALGCAVEPAPAPMLPVSAADDDTAIGPRTLVLAPGCKSGIMAAKRWPHFPALAERFPHVAVLGTAADLIGFDGRPMEFDAHVRSFIGQTSLRRTAQLLAAAGLVVANDSGLGHMAAAVGVPTLLLFGPTPHLSLGTMADNVTVLRAGLPCEPCWFTRQLAACGGAVDCLKQLSVDAVAGHVAEILGPD